MAANSNAWVIHSFMRTRREELGRHSPMDIILDSQATLDRVIDLAHQEVGGEQGAA